MNVPTFDHLNDNNHCVIPIKVKRYTPVWYMHISEMCLFAGMNIKLA